MKQVNVYPRLDLKSLADEITSSKMHRDFSAYSEFPGNRAWIIFDDVEKWLIYDLAYAQMMYVVYACRIGISEDLINAFAKRSVTTEQMAMVIKLYLYGFTEEKIKSDFLPGMKKRNYLQILKNFPNSVL